VKEKMKSKMSKKGNDKSMVESREEKLAKERKMPANVKKEKGMKKGKSRY
jgi:hypothetical protein